MESGPLLGDWLTLLIPKDADETFLKGLRGFLVDDWSPCIFYGGYRNDIKPSHIPKPVPR